VRFVFEQRIAGEPDAVQAVFLEPGFYADLAGLPNLGAPVLLGQERRGDTVLQRVRYRFSGDLAPAARAVLDPARLTWVDESVHDLAARTVRFRMLPDHYGDRLTCSGTYRFTAAGPGATVRTTDGELKVRALFVAGAVERAIVGGLRDHLGAETEVVERWVGRAGS
jgi:hypothetical protein